MGSIMANAKEGQPLDKGLPKHIGIIMDGNGRWAQSRGLPRNAGHKRGAEVFADIAKYCRKLGIEYLTIYAFSTENWKRPPDEVAAIMNLLRQYLKDTAKHQDENARLLFLGDRAPLADDLCEMIERVERESAHRTGININVALNYGGRDEIVNAVKTLARRCAAGQTDPESISENTLSDLMYTAGQPDPDLIIRPSGEQRMSNFLLWQSAYSELVFMDVLWPDFTGADLDEALKQYRSRSRRFGGI